MTTSRLTLGGLLLVASTAAAEPVDYLRQVKPLLEHHCYACHGALKQQSDLRLDTGRAMRQGDGAVVVPGQPERSRLLDVISGRGDLKMPPEGEGTPLKPDEVELLRRWIAEGAKSPADETPQRDPRQYWSYQPVRRPPVPTVQHAEWVRNPIDAFIAAKHDELGLTPQPEAERAVWLRRVTLDLTGLPPTPQELAEFLADGQPDAERRVVDRLLDSPAYGQRWGRHWMDVWRYSDWYGSRGINEIRYSQRHIWRWRDWIVDSLNADRGYDVMVQQMLAGDELSPGDPDVTRATGFIGRNWYKFDRNVWMFDAVEHTSQAFLGMTLKCCRCHDHKYDPLSQADYYRFRAFFEPHDVRTDPLTADLSTEKDATLGPVLKTGVALAYDKMLDVPTYLFQRGDNRYPDESRALSPGVPAALGVELAAIEPVALPVEAWFPALSPGVVEGLRAKADREVEGARSELQRSIKELEDAQRELAKGVGREAASGVVSGTVFRDTFEAARPDVWTAYGGEWTYADGKLTQSHTGTFPTLVANVKHPRDFRARYTYRTLEAGAIHSVGCFFDVSPLSECQAVYTATNNQTSTVQAFHRTGGAEHYPQAGIVPWPIKLGEDVTIELAARGPQLNVWVNGELALVYTLPTPRRDGTFALWTHAGAAAFDELVIDPLPENFRLAERTSEKLRSPYTPLTPADFERAVTLAERRIEIARHEVAIAEAAQQAQQATIAAELARAAALSSVPPSAALTVEANQLARQAARAQRQRAVRQAEKSLLEVEDLELALAATSFPNDEARTKASQDAGQKRIAAEKGLEAARQAATKDDAGYEPLGPTYPQASTGRRTALAKWITEPRNPRTARIAVNHIWLRHFGEALVPTVANFGLNGQPPTHPELLDWLADEFVASGWSMKHLHRLMVTSATYRMAARDADAERNRERDLANRYYWRMNSRRLEAEAIRDSVWFVAGRLDPSFGGPEIAETTGEQSMRRSVYFRSTPNESMGFLEFFDRANPNECYRRQESVVPQQALALSNSVLSLSQAQGIARQVEQDVLNGAEPGPTELIHAAFARVLSRPPTSAERELCLTLLQKHRQDAAPFTTPAAVDQLIHVLLNHNDFVTVR